MQIRRSNINATMAIYERCRRGVKRSIHTLKGYSTYVIIEKGRSSSEQIAIANIGSGTITGLRHISLLTQQSYDLGVTLVAYFGCQ